MAERCLYGVDKNPLAVEMAKLSLWLLTLAKDKPFTFLDHAIRCGDSLVGLSSIDQLLRFSMTEDAKVRPLMEQQRQQIEKRLDAVRLLRKQIETLPSNTSQDIERKTLMLANVEDQTKRLTFAADMLLAATWETRSKSELEAALNGTLAEVEYKFKDMPTEQLGAESKGRLRKAGIESRFHWPLEFPEVFIDKRGFDGFVCNPPFMGGTKLEPAYGALWRDHVVSYIAHGVRGLRGTGDLCAYFFNRADTLCGLNGFYGMIATNTISQGDTREIGLSQLAAKGATIYRATKSFRWPGSAQLEAASVWLSKQRILSRCILDGDEVPSISPSLDPSHPLLDGEPYLLLANDQMAIEGVKVVGDGFIVDQEEANRLLTADSRNIDVVRPFLIGKDINSRPDYSPSRYIINFGAWPLDRTSRPPGYDGPVAGDYEHCLRIIEERVKPERDKYPPDSSWNRGLIERWWQFGLTRPALTAAVANLSRVLVRSRVSNIHAIVFVPTEYTLSDAATVFFFDDYHHFALLQSSVHSTWIDRYASTMKTDIRYTLGSCFATFPRMPRSAALEKIGTEYYEQRDKALSLYGVGVTKLYNKFFDPEDRAPLIDGLRSCHQEMDRAVAAIYGWSDLDMGHSFHETKHGTRFTISDAARREILARLLKLNHERHAEEMAQGLHGKAKGKSPKAPRKSRGKTASEPRLFGEEDG